jgi:hypothetical protein
MCFGVQFGSTFFQLRAQQSVCLTHVGSYDAEEADGIVLLNQQRWEIADVELTDHIRLVFNVDPDEPLIRVQYCQLIEFVLE